LLDLVFHTEPHALEIEGDVAIELVLGQLRGRLEGANIERSSIVERTVQPAETLNRPPQEMADLFGLRDVRGEMLCLCSDGMQLAPDSFASLRASACDDNPL
jgi:hypothetical protein